MEANLQTNPEILESLLKERLEADIIEALAELTGIEIRIAMDIYYQSDMSRLVHEGKYGMHYLDARYLAADILENEQGLFEPNGGGLI